MPEKIDKTRRENEGAHAAGSGGGKFPEWPLTRLRPHPENGTIFGDAEDSNAYEATLASIRKHGVLEPLLVKEDGTILSGHVRLACATTLKLKTVPVRIIDAFKSYLDEVRFLIRSNTDRRQLSKLEITLAFKRLKAIPREQGGAKRKRGAPAGNANAAKGGVKIKGAEKSTIDSGKTSDAAAALLGVSRSVAEACETVFTTPGVPEALKEAVNTGKVAVTTAAKQVRAVVKEQGGSIQDPKPLAAVANAPPPKRRPKDDADLFQESFGRLVRAYKEVDAVLTRMPLASVTNTKDHHDYRAVVRDVSMRAWREIEQVDGPTNAGRQMTLIRGGAQ